MKANTLHNEATYDIGSREVAEHSYVSETCRARLRWISCIDVRCPGPTTELFCLAVFSLERCTYALCWRTVMVLAESSLQGSSPEAKEGGWRERAGARLRLVLIRVAFRLHTFAFA